MSVSWAALRRLLVSGNGSGAAAEAIALAGSSSGAEEGVERSRLGMASLEDLSEALE